MSGVNTMLGYKARPLAGIWAAPPYLHNGSVASLYELLLPPKQRLPAFSTGTREVDPQNVGFRVDSGAPGNDFTFRTHDANGALIDGNSNAGHDYGNASLSKRQRRDIVEYLKSLGIP